MEIDHPDSNDENEIVDAINNALSVLKGREETIVMKTSKLSFANCHYVLEILLKNLFLTMDYSFQNRITTLKI